MSHPFEASADELAADYACGQLSPVEALESVFARIDAWEPVLQALYLQHRERAFRDAQASERRWRRGAPLSPLDGVPVTLKENIRTEGDPTPLGTAATVLQPSPDDAPPAARLRAAGCVIIGKTTMPDIGMLSSGRSSIHGTTRNPWNTEMNPSGSSSGAGAACAAGYGPLHVGTDIGGSIRLPAAHCGIFGLKPSFGRIPIHPPHQGRVAGPMTRTVRDAAALLNVLCGGDERDFMALPPQHPDFPMSVDGMGPKGLRIALLTDMQAGLPVDPQVRAAVEAAGRALHTAGARIEPVETFMTEAMLDGVCLYLEARSHEELARLAPAQRAQLLPFVRDWAEHRAPGLTGREVMAAQGAMLALREAASALVADYDFVLSPVSPVLAYGAELAAPTNDPTRALQHIAFTVAWNFSEHPAASINWTHTALGLPLGVQVIGHRFDDLGVLRMARVIETLRPEQMAWPQP